MFHVLAFSVAVIGSILASYWDLKTTEVPDDIPYAMSIIGIIIHLSRASLAGDIYIFVDSLLVGLSLFAFGYVMYYFGQWGGADAKMLSAIGFLLPTSESISFVEGFPIFPMEFPLAITYVANLFLVGTVYMLFYASAIALKNKKVVSEFRREMKKSMKILSFSSVSLFLILVFSGMRFYGSLGVPVEYAYITVRSLVTVAATSFLFVLYKFAKAVEDVGFKKRIKVKDLREGDVLSKSRVWIGLEEPEVKKIRASGQKYVWIKEGVRFIPAFALALLFTLYYGDILFFVFGFLL